MLTKAEPRRFTIVGIARFGDGYSMGGGHTVLFTADTALALITEPGQVNAVAITAESRVSQTELAEGLQAALGSDVETLTGNALVEETKAAVNDNLKEFNVFLQVLAAIALFLGAFNINNTLPILVAQRTREMVLLRAIGASGGQVMGAVLTESVAVGALTSAAGVAVGVAMFPFPTTALDPLGSNPNRVVRHRSGSGHQHVLRVGMVQATAGEGHRPADRARKPADVVAIVAALAGLTAATGPSRLTARLDVLAAVSGVRT